MATTWLFQPSSLDNIEQIENYRKRGFHPVSIGENFARGRYRILHKLGFGGFSTVWLARDERNHRLVSLKIVTAEDLSTSNVLIQLAHVDTWSDQDVYELLGSPVTDRVRLFSGELNNMTSAPEYLVAPANLSNLESKWLAEKILLVDFGQSFMLQQPPHNDVGITMSYCAPEVYFDGKRTVWSDIWALGCMIFEIRAGCQLFESFLGGPHEVILQIVETLGKLPEPWWNSWEKRHVYFDEDGKPIKGPDICFSAEHPLIGQIRDIGAEESRVITDEGTIDENLLKNTVPAEPETESIFEPRGTRLTEAEVEVFGDLLRKVLKYNPEERLQIEKIVKHAWFMTSIEDFSRINGSSIGYND
ncbi:CMGC/SRPK protein kinase [Lipomyces tetrasporus]